MTRRTVRPSRSTAGLLIVLGASLALSGCRRSAWNRPVIWLNEAPSSEHALNDDFAFAFSLAEPCQGLSLQQQGVPKTPRWQLDVEPASPSAASGQPGASAPSQPMHWRLAHAEEDHVSFQGNAGSVEEGLRQVCTTVKQQGRR